MTTTRDSNKYATYITEAMVNATVNRNKQFLRTCWGFGATFIRKEYLCLTNIFSHPWDTMFLATVTRHNNENRKKQKVNTWKDNGPKIIVEHYCFLESQLALFSTWILINWSAEEVRPPYRTIFYFSPPFQKVFKNELNSTQVRKHETSDTRVLGTAQGTLIIGCCSQPTNPSVQYREHVCLMFHKFYDCEIWFILDNLPEREGKSKNWSGR